MLGGLLGLVGLSAVAGVLVTATVTPAIAVSGVAASQAMELFENLPSYLEVDAPMEPTTFYATAPDGTPVQLATFYDQNRVPVDYTEVATVMYDAIISSEDKNFYSHGGIDLVGTASALMDNLRNDSGRGGSSLSQQYVKNVQIQLCERGTSPGDFDDMADYHQALEDCYWEASEPSIERKLQEMRYAIQIEKDYAKNDILIGYLNIANFGGTTYGIEAAARYYFSTTALDLTIAQAATLAGMVQNPNTFRIDLPGGTYEGADGEMHNGEMDGWEDTLIRRNYVLGRLLDDGKITQEQYDEAHASPIEPHIQEPTYGCAAAGRNAYFCQYVKSIVENDPAFGATGAERQDALRRGGMEIYTTLDFRIQDPANAAMETWVPSYYEGMNLGAAAVTLETKTGRILAMAQNTMFTESENAPPGYTGLVYAADRAHGGAIGFPVGSTYKAFTLIDWLEKGHSINESLNGGNRLFTRMQCDGTNIWNTNQQIRNDGGNRGYTGTPVRFTEDSLNSGYLAMAERLNVCDINRVADRMGVTLGTGGKVTDFVQDDGTVVPDVAAPFDVLGSKNIAPLAMAGAYATIADNGIYCTPRAIDRIVGQDGTERPLPESSCTQVISPEVAATAAYPLQRVMSNGTGRQSNPWDGVPILGKTGTHEGEQTMMITSTTATTTAVWVGNSEGFEDLTQRYYNGTQLALIRHELSPWIQGAANAAYGGEDFPGPDSNLSRQVLTDLPSVIGMTVDQATQTLEDAGFQVNVGAPVDSSEAAGTVAAQDPGAGRVAGGTMVTISPSTGNGRTIPDVSGSAPAAAVAALQAAGFSNAELGTCTVNASSPSSGAATGTNPAAGQSVNRSTTVTVAYTKPSCP